MHDYLPTPSVTTVGSLLKSPVDLWHAPVVIAPNNFVYKSLSNWAANLAVGCSHGCRFCYVPSAATIKQGPTLAQYGVTDPDAEWCVIRRKRTPNPKETGQRYGF